MRIYFTFSISLLISMVLGLQLNSQELTLIYENDFEIEDSFEQFEFSDSDAWRIQDTLSNKALELFGKSDYEADVRSPFNIAVVREVFIGSFAMEVELKQTGREYGHRDMCLFFGMKDPTNFYYVHMASVADENAHNIFIVNDEPRRNIASKTTEGIVWGNDFNKIRIERDVDEGSIKVFFNDMETPIMEANDLHFRSGSIGFGSFDDTGMVDNIRIWGNKVEQKKGFFR